MDVDIFTLQQRFTDHDANFQQPLDAIKIALMLLAETFLFWVGLQEECVILVEELEQFNGFTWEKYGYHITYHYLYHSIRSPPPGCKKSDGISMFSNNSPSVFLTLIWLVLFPFYYLF